MIKIMNLACLISSIAIKSYGWCVEKKNELPGRNLDQMASHILSWQNYSVISRSVVALAINHRWLQSEEASFMPLTMRVDWHELDSQQADSINSLLGERSIAASNLTRAVIRRASITLISRYLLFLTRKKNRFRFLEEQDCTKFLISFYL